MQVHIFSIFLLFWGGVIVHKMQVRRKDFWMLSTTEKILHKFIPQLCHEADGLILQVIISFILQFCLVHTFQFSLWRCLVFISHGFAWSVESSTLLFILQGWDDPYVPRTHEGLLKWKYAHMNSVDFMLKVVLWLISQQLSHVVDNRFSSGLHIVSIYHLFIFLYCL